MWYCTPPVIQVVHRFPSSVPSADPLTASASSRDTAMDVSTDQVWRAIHVKAKLTAYPSSSWIDEPVSPTAPDSASRDTAVSASVP